MRLMDIMNTAILTADPEEPARSAFARMELQSVHHLVVRRGNQLIGVVSERDLGGKSGSELRESRTVGELMTKAPVTAIPETTVREAANLLRGRSIGCLPVIEGDKVVGIVTTSDLLDLIGRGVSGRAGERPRPAVFRRAPR